MVFNINIGLVNLKNEEAKEDADKTYALFLGETVVVNANDPATVLTTSKKQIKNIALFLKVGVFQAESYPKQCLILL